MPMLLLWVGEVVVELGAQRCEITLDPSGAAEAPAHPEQWRQQAALITAVAEIEKAAGGCREPSHHASAFGEAWEGIEAPAIAGQSLEHGTEDNVVAGAVTPVHRTLGIDAVGRVGCGRDRELIDGALEDQFGER